MSKIFELIAAFKAGQWWTAARLAVEVLNEWREHFPKDGVPQPMHAMPDRSLADVVAAIESETAMRTNASEAESGGAIVAVLIPLLLEFLAKWWKR